MRAKLTVVVGMVGALLVAVPVWGHHSLHVEYDVTMPMTLTGTIAKADLASPHGWLYLDVEGPDGTSEAWKVVIPCLVTLQQQGYIVMDFDPGLALNVRAFPARSGDPRTVAGIAASLVEEDSHVRVVSLGWFPLSSTEH